MLVTSGPGATNAVTGLVDALMDSIPLVVLTGQVPTFMIGTDAFQEADTVGITRPCTKMNWLVKDTARLSDTIHQAFHVATSGRPGPVLVDIPKDVQFATADYVAPQAARTGHYQPKMKGDPEQIARLVEMMETAERPVFYTGGGVINSGPGASTLLRELVDATGFPITSTLMGLGAYPASGKHWLGMLGMHGLYEANLAMHGCDLMINVGARFDDRITGRIADFSPHSRKAHIDIDPSSINKVIRVDVPIVGDVGNVLEDVLALWKARGRKTNREGVAKWWAKIGEWRKVDCLAFTQDPNAKTIRPQYAREAARGADEAPQGPLHLHRGRPAPDVGGAVPRLRGRRTSWMTSGGLGTMGYGFPASIGVQIAHPGCARHQRGGRGVVADEHAGDGHGDPVPAAGEAVHPEQRTARHGAAVAGAAPRRAVFAFLVGGAAGLREARGSLWGKGILCKDPADLDDAIMEMLNYAGPVIFDCLVEKHENCFPMIPSGKPHNEMLLGEAETQGVIDAKGSVLV